MAGYSAVTSLVQIQLKAEDGVNISSALHAENLCITGGILLTYLIYTN